ncbi:hypothetical protein J4G33_06445 [Actinotalea sp. BY-33]|uniref:Uncharacterized protein n=1 Tax=Actinotalea soli TaxID=2819234 RepID=A0A939LRQ9_9CELL|nr:hypothetical protein [Actinotalea soli]MBO1751440.1 hypothetical protein [Actinotalea soli]
MTDSSVQAHPADLRPLLAGVEDEVRRQRLRTVIPGAVLMLVLGAGLLLAADGDAGMGLAGAGAAALGVSGLASAVLRHRNRDLPLRTEQVDGAPATVLRRRAGWFWAGMSVLGVVAGAVLLLAVGALSTGSSVLAAGLAVVGLGLAWPLAFAAVGLYVPGNVALTGSGVRYRHLGLESMIAWEHLGAVTVLEGQRLLVLHPAPDTSAQHRYRAWPRGQRIHPDGVVTAMLQDWGTLATDVGRLVLHYAENPTERSELGTPAAAARWGHLTTRPVLHRADQWVVGVDRPSTDDDHATVDPDDGAWLPLWEPSADEHARRGVQQSMNGRLWVAVGLLVGLPGVSAFGEPGPWGPVSLGAFAAAGLTTIALGLVSPRPPELAALEGPGALTTPRGGVVLRCSSVRLRMGAVALASLAVGTVATVALFASSPGALLLGTLLALALLVVPVLVATRRLVVRELQLDEETITYRAGSRRQAVPWAQLTRVDVLRDGVIRLGLTDGDAVRIDVGGMSAHPGKVAMLLVRYRRQGGPRGETRDVGTVRVALQSG